MGVDWSRWAKPNKANEVASQLQKLSEARRAFYETSELAENDFRQVKQIAEGDYKKRQVIELIQNAVDAVGNESGPCPEGGKVKMVLTPTALYCANEGHPFTSKGFRALTYSTGTGKENDDTIGRFGLGFRSVTAVTKRPEIYSTSLSVRFEQDEAERFFRQNEWLFPGQPINLLAYPILIDPEAHAANDEVLLELMEWATTVIKLPFESDSSSYAIIHASVKDFEEEFLLFCRNVKELEFEIRPADQLTVETWAFRREVMEAGRPLRGVDGASSLHVEKVRLTNGNGAQSTVWTIFTNLDVPVPEHSESGERIERRRDRSGDPLLVTLSWALNLDLFKQGAQGQPKGWLWFYFPIPENQPSLAGIVNAPWQTNQGRTRVLDPVGYPLNGVILGALLDLVFSALPEVITLCDVHDPGRYLDILPSRSAEEDDVTKKFVRRLWELSSNSAYPSVVDLDGQLRPASEMRSYPPDISISQINEGVKDLTREWSDATPVRNFPHASLISTGGRVATLRYLVTGSEDRG